MRQLSGIVLLIALLVAAIPCSRTVAASPDYTAIDTYLEDQMQQQRIPGIALAITQGDQVVYLKGYGTAGSGRPVTPDTPMYIGSTSKSITAMAVMQLVEQGKIDLDSPIRAYLPWFRVADEQASSAITVRNLLNHASGLSDFGYMPYLPNSTSLEAGVRDLASARPTRPVGTTFQYFNPNFAILGLIVQTISRQSYADYVQQHIFTPLQMTHSYTDPADAERNGLAQGYGKLFGFPFPRPQPFHAYELPNGFLISTAQDMAHYLIAMNNGGQYGEVRVLSPESINAMWTRNSKVNNDRYGTLTPYGMGWFVSSWNGIRLIEHGGANETFHTEAMLLPEIKLGVVMLINEDHYFDASVTLEQLHSGVLDLALGRKPEPGGASSSLVGLGLLTVLLFFLVIGLRGIFRLPRWPQKAVRMTPLRRMVDIALHFLIPAVIVAGVQIGSAAYLNRGVDLLRGFDMLPDLMLILFASIVPDLIQGICKIRMVLSGRVGGKAPEPVPVKG